MIEQFKKEVDKGLCSFPKSLPSKYFYDKKGDKLFVQIMHLPEYYVTRAELDIFENQAQNIIDSLQLNPNTYFELIELGAGDGSKTKVLLHLLDTGNYNFDYFPVDISQNALDKLEKTVNSELPNILLKKKHGDYFQVLESLKNSHHLKVILFLGSNIGNMTDEMASGFIYKLGSCLSTNDKLFLGVDLIKPASIVLPAYNDSQGITSEFNLNLLKRINRELGGDFDTDKFVHQPEYTESEGIAKSYLVSTTDQKVDIKKIGKTYYFKKGEKISTEISRKYNDEIIGDIIRKTDFKLIRKLTDSKQYFANYVLIRE
jgi:dimethylhistidine N-methyltransferase